MTFQFVRSTAVALAAAALLSVAACNKSARTDAQITADVQGKIKSDQAVTNKQISVTAGNGVVTLSGPVSTDAERSAAANDAASVAGVRTVVNNLTVQPQDQSAQNQPPADNSQQASPPPQPASSTAKSSKPAAQGSAARAVQQGSAAQAMQQAQEDNQAQQAAQNAPPPPPAAPQPPPDITIPSGTPMAIRMLDTVDSETASAGDTFRATLNSPVVVDGRTVIPADADLFGPVVDVHAAGRFQGRGLLTLELNRVAFNGRSYNIHTDTWSKQTDSRGKGTAEKVGGGAALGAIIGAIAGGGKGAGIGAAVGAGAGGVTQAAIKAAQIKLGPESLLTFRLSQPVAVEPAAHNERNAGRQPLQ